MLYDGICQAIKNLREHKNLSQKQVEKAGGIVSGTLSKWERGKRIPNASQMAGLLKGLQATEIELWEEKVQVERAYYLKLAIDRGERVPKWDVSVVADHLSRLLGLDMGAVDAELRIELHELRNLFASHFTGLHAVLDRFIALYEKISLHREEVN